MADTENRDIDFKTASQGQNGKGVKVKKPHGKKSLAWWAGVIVLILISITFILPATGVTSLFMDSGIEFGRYNGQPIEYSNGSYMFNQYYNLYLQYGAYMDSSSLLYQAYYTAVLHEALTQKAEDVGLYVSEEMINHGIIDSGYYNTDGVFDETVYQNTGVSERTGIYNSVRDGLPANIVLTDIGNVLSSDAEKDFVTAMGATGWTFDYVAFDSSSYPADLAASYAEGNPQPFEAVTVSTLEFTSQEEADTAFDEISADSTAFDTRLAESGAESSLLCRYELSAIGEENVNTLLASSAGTIVGPWQNGSSYVIYRVEDVATPDYSSDEMVAKIRSYIASNNPELVTQWAEGASQDFYASASDFDSAAESAGLEIHRVGFTPAGNGLSSILTGLSGTDSYGLLATAASGSDDFNNMLFDSEAGTVLAPEETTNAWIVVRTNGSSTDTSQSSFIDTMYDYLASTLAQGDMQNAILTSSLFEDNFYTVLIEQVLSDAQ